MVTIDTATKAATIGYNDGSKDATAVVQDVRPGVVKSYFHMTYEIDTETGLLRIFKDTELLASGYVKNNAKNVSALKFTLGAKSDSTSAIRLQNMELKASKTDDTDVSAAAAWLEEQIPSETFHDLTLPVRYDDGNHSVSISWESNNTDYITSDGTVTRPLSTDGNRTVTLTASLKCGTAAITKNVDVTVIAKGSGSPESMLNEAGALLTWDVISVGQQQTAVGKALLLPEHRTER